jgi:hypothetical protein
MAMSEEPEEHKGLLDDEPALDYILYEEMTKDEQQNSRKKPGGCLPLILFMIVPLVSSFLLILFFLLFIPSISNAIDKPDHYCDDQASWQKWEKLLTDNPGDDGIASLYAFRVGLCSMVKSGQIETERATKLFEGLRDKVIRSAEEAKQQAMKEQGI